MDVSIIAALIGAAGSIVGAIVTAIYSRQEPAHAVPTRHRKLVFIVLLVALAVGGLISLVLYDGTHYRISTGLPIRQGYRRVIYDKVGPGFLLPNQWRIDDSSFRFGGGDIDLIRDYDPSAGSISQGIKLRYINVQENYVNEPEAEYGNEEEVLEAIDPRESTVDVQLAGWSGKKFVYMQRAGGRLAYLERTWIHVTPRVKLEVLSVSNLDENTRRIFNGERDGILQSLVLDRIKIAKLSDAQ